VQLDLETPHTLGTYQMEIGTYDSFREALIDYNTLDIVVNDTYGVNEVWRTHPINSPVTLRAG
jgi:hypothetical protein